MLITDHGSSVTKTSITRTTSKTVTCTDVKYTGARDYISDGCNVCETHPYINYSECTESSAEALLLGRTSVNESYNEEYDPESWISYCGYPIFSYSNATVTSLSEIDLTTVCQNPNDKITELLIYGRASVQDVTTPSEIKINNTSPVDLNQYDEDPSPSRWAGYLTWKIPVLIACGDNYNLKLDVANGNVRVSSIKTTITECHLTIYNLYSSISKFNPSNGETVTVSGSILETTGKNVTWSLSVAGRSFSGTGKTVSVEWDGKDASGNIVTPGSYTATLTANTDDGVCERLKSIQVTVDNEPVKSFV